ncbi:unnamed protein product [Durusdinium trenchii]|uniref:Uncharacterized protein n=1 Tax=Durusdinium trenchii TaxID=1381693 RepID=A0ABP0IJH5_9DINO
MSTPDLSLLPLKPGDQLWRRLSDGTCWHALYVGQFLLVFAEDGVTLTLQPAQGEILPPCVVAVQASEAGSAVTRIPLTEFVDPSCGPGDAKETEECTSPTRVSAADISVRLYARRPRGRRAAVARALTAIGTQAELRPSLAVVRAKHQAECRQVDRGALLGLPELLPWWAIFDESNDFQPGLCASRSRAVRYRLSPKAEGSTVPPQLLNAVLAGGAVMRQGRVVLRGIRLVKALRLGKAAGAVASASTSWANLGGDSWKPAG